ncbi:Nucleoside permease NupC, partial [hydrothermal vent metagenome]
MNTFLRYSFSLVFILSSFFSFGQTLSDSLSSDSTTLRVENTKIVTNTSGTISPTEEKIDKKLLSEDSNLLISIPRGLLGMASLILIAYLFSSNRKAISWQVVFVGLGTQLVLAFGILNLAWVRATFEFFGKIFIKVLDFTRNGSEFLFGGLLNIDSFGFIFALQILPTIIFFSALTSVLFY